MITVENLTKKFGDDVILENVSCEIQDGEIISIIGPSGCGKTTFLRCINLLETPTGGKIFIDDKELTAVGIDINEVRRNFGMVFQSFNLFKHKNVLENVIMAPMVVLGQSKKEAIEHAMEYLDLVGMTYRANHMPSQLSGGQKQRVAIARCLAMNPKAILFDEPTSALDPTMVDEVLSVIKKLASRGMTCIIVTHEMEFARNVSSRIFFMGDKGIYEQGSPQEIFEKPKREKTKAFIQRLKVIKYERKLEEFDLYELNQEISDYVSKYDLGKKTKNYLTILCEEISEYWKTTRIRDIEVKVRIEYSDRTNKINVSFFDNLPQQNPMESGLIDEISEALIMGIVEESSYNYDNKVNEWSMSIKRG